MKIWLDDKRNPPDDTWVWCKSSLEAFAALYRAETEDNQVTEIAFDFDLGDGDEAGVVANYIEFRANFNLIKRMKWSVHSDNTWSSRVVAAMESADRFWTQHEKAEHYANCPN